MTIQYQIGQYKKVIVLCVPMGNVRKHIFGWSDVLTEIEAI